MANGFQGLLGNPNAAPGFQGLASDPLFNIGLGLLSESAPSVEPANLGRGIQSGLQNASAAQQQQLRNQALREQLTARSRRREALQQLFQTPGQREDLGTVQGLLDSTGQDPIGGDLAQNLLNVQTGGERSLAERRGLLAQAFPEQVGQAAVAEAFPQAQGRAAPAVVREAQFIFPNDPQKQRDFVLERSSQGDISQQLDLLTAQQRQIQIQQSMRQVQDEQVSRKRKRSQLASGLRSDVDKTLEQADLNDELEDTVLKTGVPGSEFRRNAISGASGVSSFFGGGQPAAQGAVDKFDRFDTLESTALTDTAARAFEDGSLSRNEFEAFKNSQASTSKSPAANRAALADRLELITTIADRESVDIPNREAINQKIQQLRSGPAPVGTTGAVGAGTPAVGDPAKPAKKSPDILNFDDGTTLEFR